jgi:hypothetical protein|tara:strand:- start:6372 stop:6866 length:495 start_codon:yes stop_codon:yes gene_type:complete
MNLSENASGMVPINHSTSFMPENFQEKNVGEKKDTMDSTPISDIMGQPQPQQQQFNEPPAMAMDPRMLDAQPRVELPRQVTSTGPQKSETTKQSKKNPFNLTDDQFHALLVVACTGVAVSKPIQEKLANTVPKFLNAQGGRSLVGIASTGAVAGIIFFVMRRYT